MFSSLLASSMGIGGVLLLARALLELVRGLAELNGAGGHMAGDVMIWLILVLPVPIAVGLVGLVVGRWLARHPIGAGRATALWVALLVAGGAWILLYKDVVNQGGSFMPFDDPLLWPPVAAILGALCGAAVLVVSVLARRRSVA